MENVFQGLEPQKVWHYFAEICKIPRPSKHEEHIVEYIYQFGKSRGLETLKDEAGNVVIRKPAEKGFEHLPMVALQSHVDMVCEKNNDVEHDFMKDPIRPRIDGEWVKASGTTLGADDGIGVAVQLALLDSTGLGIGAIECVFTTDEETGLTGAFALEGNMITAGYLVNLDSEDEGEIFIGCAGGKDTSGYLPVETKPAATGRAAFRVTVGGLKGGHSGDDIHRGLGNANKILNRFILKADREIGIELASFDGGNLRNAIAREAVAVITIPSDKAALLSTLVEQYGKIIATELKVTDDGVFIKAEKADAPAEVLSDGLKNKLIQLIYALPHGVVAWSQDIPDFVETSTNLASVKMKEGKIVIATSQRSSLESAKENICNKVACTFALGGASYEQGDGYPGWTPNPNSKLLKVAESEFEKMFTYKPVVRAIHAGLECGLFSEKWPQLEMISVGPTLRGVHSPDEKLKIDTVERFWKYTLRILQNIS